MSSIANNVNLVIMNKYCWMSRQLRNFNDTNSIIHWSNAMFSVKALLLQPCEADTMITPLQPSAFGNASFKKHAILTFSRSNSIDFLPTVEPPHTLSQMHTSNFQPHPPSPLSIFTPRELSIQPHTPPYESPKPASKRRKTTVPPQVDCEVLPSQLSTTKLQYRTDISTTTIASRTSQPTRSNTQPLTETQVAQVKACVLRILEDKRKHGHLRWEDRHTPFWARTIVEARLDLSKHCVSRIKETVTQAVNYFYSSHGKHIPRWADR